MPYNLSKQHLNAFGAIHLGVSKVVSTLISDKSIVQEKEAIFIYLHEYLSSCSLDTDSKLIAASLISYRSYNHEREIIKLRYGIGDGYTYTLEEVGKLFNVTRERVRQIEAKAVRKLQHPVRSRKLEGFLESAGGC